MFERRFGEVESLGGHVPALLSQITSHSVTEIRLRCDPIVMEVLKDDVWTDMARILEKPQFSSLRRITFLSTGTFHSEKTVELVGARLAGCNERGILYFGCMSGVIL